MLARHGMVATLTAMLFISAVTIAAASPLDDAKESVRHHLLIPGSARFHNLHPHGDYICGKVDAKTLDGAYVGPKIMMYNTKTQLSTIVDVSGISMIMTDTMKTDMDRSCVPGNP